MSEDITPILRGWEYDPDDVNARKITGLDGREKIQMRIDLGLIQMEAVGRPDGCRPHGRESCLEYHLARLEAHLAREGGPSGFNLTPEECEELRDEGIQYYFRYLSLFHLGDYRGVVRDTARNLRLFNLTRDHAEGESDRQALEQYRAYVVMMNTRARAMMAVERRELRRAGDILQEGIGQIEEFLRSNGQDEAIEQSPEIALLQEFAQQIETDSVVPSAPDALRDELQRAIAQEDYERAAQIRDELKRIGATASP